AAPRLHGWRNRAYAIRPYEATKRADPCRDVSFMPECAAYYRGGRLLPTPLRASLAGLPVTGETSPHLGGRWRPSSITAGTTEGCRPRGRNEVSPARGRPASEARRGVIQATARRENWGALHTPFPERSGPSCATIGAVRRSAPSHRTGRVNAD